MSASAELGNATQSAKSSEVRTRAPVDFRAASKEQGVCSGGQGDGVWEITGLSGLLLALVAVAAAPAASATPAQPGDGDAFFIPNIQTVLKPSPPESSIRAIIPLAHQVCDARAKGQDDLQAAHIVWASKATETLGLANGSVIGLRESSALDIVGAATLAYCPQYNNGVW